jgi:hypothetical protein
VRLSDFLWHARNGHRSGELGAEVSAAREDQLFNFNFREWLLASEQVRDECDLRKMLDRFHLHVGVLKSVSIGDHAMVRHEDRIVAIHVGFQRLRQLGSTGRAVACQWDTTKSHDDFADQRLSKRNAGSRKTGCSRWMGMHDRLNIWTAVVNQQVHADFAGDMAAAGQLLPLTIHHNHVRRPHGTLAHARGSHKDAVVFEPDGEIAVHGGDEAAFVKHASVADNFFPEFALCGQDNPLGGITELRASLGIRMVAAVRSRKQWPF